MKGNLLPIALWLPLLFAVQAASDDIGEAPAVGASEAPVSGRSQEPDRAARYPDLAPLWDHIDPALQKRVEDELHDLGLGVPIRQRRLSVVLVDVSEAGRPRVASVNGDVMMYAASLPKIAILLAVYQKAAEGGLEIDDDIRAKLETMIRDSSNSAATELMHQVGKAYIAQVLCSPRYRLYDPARNGGLWVGKDYAKAGLWKRDPLHNLSHGATAMQVARFYYLLDTGNLVTPKDSREMKKVLAHTRLRHKFVKVLERINPAALLFRKSGSWHGHHADSVLAKRDGRGYIAVALSEGAEGSRWLGEIIEVLDDIIFPHHRFWKMRG